MMPVWQKTVEPFVAQGKLAVVGVIQEQHPDRARLYRQWKKIQWPILVDSLNTLDLTYVPIPITIDERGVVRQVGIKSDEFRSQFMERDFEDPGGAPVSKAEIPSGPAGAFYRGEWDAAVQGYENAVRSDPKDSRARFRLGVALRRRYESPQRKAGDAQAALEEWSRALALEPNQYIWRRRIQQYGPRLDKPYNFYFWIEEARRDIRARGEEPLPLEIEPSGSEVAAPDTPAARQTMKDPDPEGKIARDARRLVLVEPAVAPACVKPGNRARARVAFRPKAFWNNETDPLTMTVSLPAFLKLQEGTFAFPPPPQAESGELRFLEFEVTVAPDAPAGTIRIPAYALYAVCEKERGVCRFLRQDFELAVVVDPAAPKY